MKEGLIAEAWNEEAGQMSSIEPYRRFWFEGDGDTRTVFRPGVRVVALHHSWTPDWFRKLSREEVLSHDCRLSRALTELLNR